MTKVSTDSQKQKELENEDETYRVAFKCAWIASLQTNTERLELCVRRWVISVTYRLTVSKLLYRAANVCSPCCFRMQKSMFHTVSKNETHCSLRQRASHFSKNAIRSTLNSSHRDNCSYVTFAKVRDITVILSIYMNDSRLNKAI